MRLGAKIKGRKFSSGLLAAEGHIDLVEHADAIFDLPSGSRMFRESMAVRDSPAEGRLGRRHAGMEHHHNTKDGHWAAMRLVRLLDDQPPECLKHRVRDMIAGKGASASRQIEADTRTAPCGGH